MARNEKAQPKKENHLRDVRLSSRGGADEEEALLDCRRSLIFILLALRSFFISARALCDCQRTP